MLIKFMIFIMSIHTCLAACSSYTSCSTCTGDIGCGWDNIYGGCYGSSVWNNYKGSTGGYAVRYALVRNDCGRRAANPPAPGPAPVPPSPNVPSSCFSWCYMPSGAGATCGNYASCYYSSGYGCCSTSSFGSTCTCPGAPQPNPPAPGPAPVPPSPNVPSSCFSWCYMGNNPTSVCGNYNWCHYDSGYGCCSSNSFPINNCVCPGGPQPPTAAPPAYCGMTILTSSQNCCDRTSGRYCSSSQCCGSGCISSTSDCCDQTLGSYCPDKKCCGVNLCISRTSSCCDGTTGFSCGTGFKCCGANKCISNDADCCSSSTGFVCGTDSKCCGRNKCIPKNHYCCDQQDGTSCDHSCTGLYCRNPPNTGLIVGCSLGGFVGFMIIVFILIKLYERYCNSDSGGTKPALEVPMR